MVIFAAEMGLQIILGLVLMEWLIPISGGGRGGGGGGVRKRSGGLQLQLDHIGCITETHFSNSSRWFWNRGGGDGRDSSATAATAAAATVSVTDAISQIIHLNP